MVHGYVPFKIESDNPTPHSRWLLSPKIENSSIVHCCLFIYQNELKYLQQLYSNEYFNMYFGFFCEIFHSANLYRFKSSSLKPLNQICHGWSLGDPLLKVYPTAPTFYSRWWLLLKIEILSLSCCFIISQNELNF